MIYTDSNWFSDLWFVWVILGCIIFAVIIFLIVFFLLRHKKKNKRNNIKDIIESLGGKDNISSISCFGSRITVELVNVEKILNDEIIKSGVDNTILMSDKIILIKKDNADVLKKDIENYIK